MQTRWRLAVATFVLAPFLALAAEPLPSWKDGASKGAIVAYVGAITQRGGKDFVFNLRTDPYERADITSNTYNDWLLAHSYLVTPAQAFVAKFLGTFKEYPQRQKAASFNLDDVMRQMTEPQGSK